MNGIINSRIVADKARVKDQYDIDEVIYEAGNLKDLLGTIRFLISDLDFGTPDNRNQELQRVASLVEIGVNLADCMFAQIYENAHTLAGRIASRHA